MKLMLNGEPEPKQNNGMLTESESFLEQATRRGNAPCIWPKELPPPHLEIDEIQRVEIKASLIILALVLLMAILGIYFQGVSE